MAITSIPTGRILSITVTVMVMVILHMECLSEWGTVWDLVLATGSEDIPITVIIPISGILIMADITADTMAGTMEVITRITEVITIIMVTPVYNTGGEKGPAVTHQDGMIIWAHRVPAGVAVSLQSAILPGEAAPIQELRQFQLIPAGLSLITRVIRLQTGQVPEWLRIRQKAGPTDPRHTGREHLQMQGLSIKALTGPILPATVIQG